MSNFAWRYYSLNFTCSCHFQWPWPYFKVTVMSNTFNWKIWVLIQLSSNFVGSSSKSSRKWIYHYFSLLHIFKGDDWRVFWFDKKLKRCAVATYIENIMHDISRVNGVHSREIISMFFFSQMSGLFKNFNIGIYSNTIDVKNVKLYLLVILIELYLFMPFSVTLVIFEGHSYV